MNSSTIALIFARTTNVRDQKLQAARDRGRQPHARRVSRSLHKDSNFQICRMIFPYLSIHEWNGYLSTSSIINVTFVTITLTCFMGRGLERLTVAWIDSVNTELVREIMKHPQYESRTTSNAKS